MLRSLLLLVSIAGFAAAASAQTIVINPNRSGVLPSPTPTVQPIRISLSVNTFVPTPGGDSAQALKAQEDGRKVVYESAAHECDVLREVLAKDCQLDSININVQHVPANQNFNGARVDGYNINGSINFQIVPKDVAAKDNAPKDNAAKDSAPK
jgi:hypothetical protein